MGWGGGGVRVCYEMVMSFAKIILLNQSLCFSMNYFFSQNDTVSLSQCMYCKGLGKLILHEVCA